ncbi:MAG: UDP-N-acetylmuramoyl-L-alanyl-D-glutamate--2,6-diaminopimelate ligase [Methylococcaceae bacterium]|nr:UDP-N-acetylmuramoyl-L-alanyl-D-glutamate--2,6-diaminopimelate ligase [Methylococcaceae bacterium]
MKLTELLAGIVDDLTKLDSAIEIKGIALDSRNVSDGFVFLAIAGEKEHGLVYVQQAIENGATVVIYDPLGSETFVLNQLNIYQLAIMDLGLKLACIADRFYQSPSNRLDVIGITGTNGKTTCSQFLVQLIAECGVIGTLGWGDNCTLKETINTTPDAIKVQQMLAEFVTQNKRTVVMEVSSHGLQQGRVNEVHFKGAVFTNLSRDHLDYHGSMDGYLNAKRLLFKQPDLQFVVVNTDDANSEQFLAVTAEKVKCWAFSATGKKRQFKDNKSVEKVSVDEVNFSLDGINFFVSWRKQRAQVQTHIVGDFNLENMLTVITVLLAQGCSLSDACSKVSQLTPVPGRMERFGGTDTPFIFVDYAHTPDALEKVLRGLKKYCHQTLTVVFGCGGNRDKGKRKLMGEIAAKLADQVIITNDNPRFENPEQIINDIVAGCAEQDYEVIQNREKAIQTVIKKADKMDCIVIAGKGHEEYQDVNGIKQLFRDQDVVKQALQEWTDSA